MIGPLKLDPATERCRLQLGRRPRGSRDLPEDDRQEVRVDRADSRPVPHLVPHVVPEPRV